MSDQALAGTLSGASRAEILARIKEAAAAYFGTGCVVVKLTAERIDGEHFAADYTAVIWHDIERRSFGPGICRGCKAQNWPDRPLNHAKEWA